MNLGHSLQREDVVGHDPRVVPRGAGAAKLLTCKGS
jgi:hypothetical protein